MKRSALVLFALSFALAAHAQIYQWQDDSGKTIISDKPPLGKVHDLRKVDSGSAASSAASPKSLAERDLEFRKRLKESQENADKAKKEKEVSAEKQEQCASASRYLRSLESGERIALRDEKGERYFLDDAQRAQEIEKARKAAQENCK